MIITHRTGELNNLKDVILKSNDIGVCEDNLFEIAKFSLIKICYHLYDCRRVSR